MHDIKEAIQIYNDEKSKNPNYDTVLVEEWRELMPEQFIRKMLKKKYGCHIIDQETYDKAVELLEWIDKKGNGAKWSIDDIERVANIEFEEKEYTLLDYSYVINMLYSDYCNVFTDANYYIRMALNFLEDNDYPGKASERAYHNAIKRINYFTKE